MVALLSTVFDDADRELARWHTRKDARMRIDFSDRSAEDIVNAYVERLQAYEEAIVDDNEAHTREHHELLAAMAEITNAYWRQERAVREDLYRIAAQQHNNVDDALTR